MAKKAKPLPWAFLDDFRGKNFNVVITDVTMDVDHVILSTQENPSATIGCTIFYD